MLVYRRHVIIHTYVLAAQLARKIDSLLSILFAADVVISTIKFTTAVSFECVVSAHLVNTHNNKSNKSIIVIMLADWSAYTK